MRYHAIAIILLMISASLAGCTADEGSSTDDVDDTVENIGGTSNETINQTTNDTAGKETTDGGNGTTSGCTVLLQITEVAIQAPGNTSWTNHTYDSNCELIRTTIDGRVMSGVGGGGVPYSPDFWTYNYDSNGNIVSSNYTSGSAGDAGYQQFSNTTYHYDAAGQLITVEHQTTAVSFDVNTGETDVNHYDPYYSNYSYDSSGREITMHNNYSEDDWRWHNSTYNLEGLIETYTVEGTFPDANQTTIYYYDSNDVLIKIYSDNALQMGECYSNFTYDSQGMLTQIRAEYAWGEIVTNTTYDSEGRVSTEIITFDADDYDMHYHNTKTYVWGQV